MITDTEGGNDGPLSGTPPTRGDRALSRWGQNRGNLPRHALREKLLYKWKARYQADDPAWTTGLSTQPRHKASQTPQPMAQSIVTLHRTLVQRGKSGSAAAIQEGLRQQGIAPIPSLRTIYRIVQRYAKEDS